LHTNEPVKYTTRTPTQDHTEKPTGAEQIQENYTLHTHRPVKYTTRTPTQDHREKFLKYQQECTTATALVNIIRIFWQNKIQAT
jgi:hypothetical protein